MPLNAEEHRNSQAHITQLAYAALLPSSSTSHSSSKPSSSTEHALIIELGHQDFKTPTQGSQGWPTSGKMPFLFAVDIKHGDITHQAHLATQTRNTLPPNPTPHPSPTNEGRTDRAQDK
ncbi:hypothetical protein CF327_g4153 [Tilletia walkeri]|nr:hypothetical protein CF327_g4153 [Tilletia walkeri]